MWWILWFGYESLWHNYKKTWYTHFRDMSNRISLISYISPSIYLSKVLVHFQVRITICKYTCKKRVFFVGANFLYIMGEGGSIHHLKEWQTQCTDTIQKYISLGGAADPLSPHLPPPLHSSLRNEINKKLIKKKKDAFT